MPWNSEMPLESPPSRQGTLKNLQMKWLGKSDQEDEQTERHLIVEVDSFFCYFVQISLPLHFLISQKGVCQESENEESRFPNNHIRTSKYTKWTFLPMNLYEQLKRPANFYYVCIAILQVCFFFYFIFLTSPGRKRF